MSFLKLEKSSGTTKRYLFDSIYSQTRLSRHYFWQLILSTIITTLGLLTDNTAVVIGAMLISPLFWPVMGIALGIITSRKHILGDSSVSLGVSILAVVFFSALIGLVTPVAGLPSEVTSRMNPNIIDLFIALATSIIGVLALYYPSISASTAGVAISISLLPPLCVTGIGLAKLSAPMIGRSLLLFGTNTGAIVFMGVIVLYLLNIKPVKVDEEKRFKYGIIVSGLFMILLSIPLSFYLKESLAQKRVSNEIERIIEKDILKVSPAGKVEKVQIDFLSLRGGSPINVDAVVYLPEGVNMTQTQREELLDRITTVTKSDVNLKFNLVSTLSIQSEEDQVKGTLRKNIREIVTTQLKSEEGEIVIDSIDITFPFTKQDPEKYHTNITIIVKQFGRIPIDTKDLEDLKKFLETRLNITAEIQVEFIPVSKLSENSIDSGSYERVKRGFEEILLREVNVEDLSIKDNIVTAKIYLPQGFILTVQDTDSMLNLVKKVLGEDKLLELQILRYEVF